jgi:Flp pilus assembly protein TadD
LERFDQAEAAYRNAIVLTPKRAGGYATLAEYYVQSNRKLDEAKALAVKAIQLEPVAKHYSLLATICQKIGDRPGALAAIRHATELDADNQRYREVLKTLAGGAEDGGDE